MWINTTSPEYLCNVSASQAFLLFCYSCQYCKAVMIIKLNLTCESLYLLVFLSIPTVFLSLIPVLVVKSPTHVSSQFLYT